jgi:NADPH:quinone reductase-like Zn-dependent oxidoreductase
MSTTVTHPQTSERTAAETYKAAVVQSFTEPLVVEDVPRRALEPGQVRVKVEASGLCHTDIHAAHGDWPVKPSPPFVPGHEGIGIVAELGPGVTEVEVGQRVAMPWLGYACGACDYCVSGWETLCLGQKNMGYSIDGGFGEYATAYARYVVEVPDGVSSSACSFSGDAVRADLVSRADLLPRSDSLVIASAARRRPLRLRGWRRRYAIPPAPRAALATRPRRAGARVR